MNEPLQSAGKPKGSRVWDVVFVVAGLGVLALAFALNVGYLDYSLGRIGTTEIDIHADYHTFWQSARGFIEGTSVYDTGARLPNLNPPLWTLVISPLGFLEPMTGYRIFIGLTVVLVISYLAWMSGRLNLSGGRASLIMAMLLFSSPFLATLALGQIYAFLTLGLIATWYFDRCGSEVASGVALGLTLAVKPSLLPLLLWPVMRRRWSLLISTLVTGAAVTLLAALVVGFGATFDWIGLLRDSTVTPYWDNASLPSAAARLFTENEFARPLAIAPLMIPVAYIISLALVVFTAWVSRRDAELGLFSLVAVSLISSPIAWHNYLMLLAPGVLILAARRRFALAFLLLCLESIPPQWPLIWRGEGTPLASLMLCLYLFILLLHWAALLPDRD